MHLFGLTILGGALLWTVNLIYGRHRPAADDLLRRVLIIIGWLLVLVGLLAGLGGALLGIVAVAVILMVVNRLRRAERRALAMVIGVAAEQGVPLPHAVRAFAGDCSDQQSLRALRLAELLEQGTALPRALDASYNRPTRGLRAAIEFGWETGALGPAIRRVSQDADDTGRQARSFIEKAIYLFAVVLAVGLMLSFMMIMIVPRFDMLFQSFSVDMPQPTKMLLSMSRAFNYFELFWLLTLLLAAPLLGATILLAFLAYVGWFPGEFPLLGGFTFRANAATVLRLLSLSVERNQPLLQTLSFLGARYPHALIRARLRQTVSSMNNGGQWCDGLRAAKIIQPGDAAVLRAAERVRNLAWALEETADSSMRRVTYRSAAFLNVLFPVALVSLALATGFIVAAMMMPLSELILRLIP